MNTEHPAPVVPLEYAPPPPKRSYAGVVLRAITTVLVTAVVFGAGGALIGLTLGLLVPDYYRGVFQATGPDFVPSAVGFGLGLSQGAALGAACGVALAGILAWRETRVRAADRPV